MSGRKAKRARRQRPAGSDPSLTFGVKPGGLLEAVTKAPDRCPTCGEAHHKPLFPVKSGGPLALSDPAVQDTITHSLFDAYAVLRDHGIPEDRWMDVLSPVAKAIGFVVSAGESYGRRHAIELFFEGLVEEQGFGTYVIELGPNGIVGNAGGPT